MKTKNQLSPLNEKESIAVLNTLLTGFEFLECLDQIKQTTLHRQSIKNKVSSLVGELKSYSDGLQEIFGVDDEALFNIMEHKEQLMKKLAHVRPEIHSGLNQLLEAYFQMPELTLHRLGIKIIDRN